MTIDNSTSVCISSNKELRFELCNMSVVATLVNFYGCDTFFGFLLKSTLSAFTTFSHDLRVITSDNPEIFS